uniref:Uncharacterized protein n=1 Tax=Aureoumbra lagunensis TaxID=44058 RepID=A0A7S3JXV8_9STRA
MSEDLDLQFLDWFAIRTCTRGVTVRRQHLAAVERVCSAFGVPQILPIVARLPPRLRLAFILGSPRKFTRDIARLLPNTGLSGPGAQGRMPLEMQWQLTQAFVTTWGVYSAGFSPK